MHFANQGHRNGGLLAAFGPVATIGALGLTVFLGPNVYPPFEPMVWQALVARYDYQAAMWLSWGIKIASYPAVYVILRLAIMAGLMSLSAWAARRLM
ncbi:MAG: hypothetical protein AAGG56_05600 [Pseudomonadota bacterium]